MYTIESKVLTSYILEVHVGKNSIIKLNEKIAISRIRTIVPFFDHCYFVGCGCVHES